MGCTASIAQAPRYTKDNKPLSNLSSPSLTGVRSISPINTPLSPSRGLTPQNIRFNHSPSPKPFPQPSKIPTPQKPPKVPIRGILKPSIIQNTQMQPAMLPLQSNLHLKRATSSEIKK